MISQDARPQSLVNDVTDAVGYQIAGALTGALIVYGLNQFTPLRAPWWLGVAVGAGLGASAQWSKEHQK